MIKAEKKETTEGLERNFGKEEELQWYIGNEFNDIIDTLLLPQYNAFAGGAGDDEITGHEGTQHLFGNEGSDWLNGGRGRDFLHGGQGNDKFGYTDASHFEGPSDLIADFEKGDKFVFEGIHDLKFTGDKKNHIGIFKSEKIKGYEVHIDLDGVKGGTTYHVATVHTPTGHELTHDDFHIFG